MHIRTLPLAEALDHLLLHNIADASGQKVVGKGTRLSEADLAALRATGHHAVEVAILEADDVHEDEAAERIAGALGGGAGGLRLTRAVGGRVNLHAEQDGVLRVGVDRLSALNSLPGVTLATRPQYATLGPRFETSQAATLKIVPYAISRATVDEALALAAGMLTLAPLRPRRVALLITADAGSVPRLQRQFEEPTRARLARLGSDLVTVEAVAAEEGAIAAAVQRLLVAHDGLVIGGQTSIMDREDTTLRALERVGGAVALHGAPVEPGNLLALAYDGPKWLLCAPGCAKSLAHNVVDLVLPRLLTDERLGRAEIAELGLGGLL